MEEKNKMAVENKNESTAKKLEIEMLRKMGIDVVLDKDEFSSVLKANETLQKMELELNELAKLNNELNSLKDEKKSIDNSNQKLKEKTVERGKNNFAEFIEAAKTMKNFIPENNELRSYFTYWGNVNKITLSLNNELKEDDKSRYFITIAKDPENNIVCIRENNASDAVIYFSEKDNVVNENEKVWFLYNIFSSSNRIDELKIAIKENLEKRIGKTKEQLSEAHKNLLEAEKAAKKANLLSENKTNSHENLSIDNSTTISNDEFLELSRSIDYKSFELLANKIQAGSAEYWTNMACVQIEEYNTNQLKWILDNREVRFDEVERSYSLNKQQDEIKKTLNLPQWAAVSDDPETIDIVFSKMTEKDFKWAKENGVFKIAEDFYKDKSENFSFSFETLKDWVKKYDPDYSNDKIVRHFYARQVPPEDQYFDIDSELADLDISIIESYSGSRYTEIINNDIPNGSMEKFTDTMNEISDDYENFFKDGVNPTEEDIKNGKAVYKSFEEALNTELPKKDGAKYTEEEIKEWRNIFEQYGNAGDMGSYWSSTNATHAVLTQVMELQTGESFVSVSLKGSSQGEDVTAVIPEHIYTEEFRENLEAKYWNEGVEYLVFEDNTGMHHNLEELQEHDIFENNSVSYYLPSYKSVEKLASVLGARKGELTVYDFEGYEKSPKYEKVQYMKTLSNPLDDLRTVLKAYEHGFDNDYKLDEYDKNRITKGKWSIATGGYDLAWEVYYENIPVASCDTDNILIGNNNNSFTGFTEADMLRVITQEYKNVKCPEIEIPTVEDYEQYLNDYFHDGSFTLEPENAFDEYPFEKLLNENLERHYHYEKDSAGGVILSYDYSNHTEYLQPGDDANTFLDEVEKIESGVIQINAEEQLDNLINNYFPDFFPDNFRDEDTKTFITQQDIIEAVDNFECGKLYKEYDPEGFSKDAHEWIKNNSPAFTNISELPKTENQISNGQVLGFVKDNKIYINIDSFNSETPIHEYTHLWDKAIQKTNPELWKQGVELLKKTNTWKEIERNPAYADIAGDEDLLASEVHARLVGKNGAEIFNNIVTENPSITSEEIQKSAQKWDEKAWKHVRENFTNWKNGDLQTSVKDFVNITLNDFLNGKNPVQNIENNISQENIQMQYERKTHNEYTLMSNYGYGWEEETAWDNYKDAKQGLTEYRENGGGSYYLKHHTRVPNGFCVTDGHYVPEEDITPENFKTYFKAALKLRQIAGNPQKAAAYCFKHANMPSKLQNWLEKQGCTNKENSDKLFEKWAKEERKPEQKKTKTNSKENEDWSISD